MRLYCTDGHPLSGAGADIYVTPDGRRLCRACRSEASTRYRDSHHDDVRERERDRDATPERLAQKRAWKRARGAGEGVGGQ